MAGEFDLEGARKAGYSDAEITGYLAEQRGFDLNGARQAGYSDEEIFKRLTTTPGDFSRGAQVALGQTVPLMKGVVGLAGATAEKAFGEGGYATKIKNWGLTGAQEGMDKLQPLQDENDDVTVAWNRAKEGDLGAMVDWAQYALGYGMAQMAESAAVGVAGAAIGGAVGGGVGAAPGAVAGIVGREATKGLIRQMIEREVARRAGENATEAAVKAATKSVARDMGAVGALTGYNVGIEAGTIYPDAVEQAQKEGRELTGSDLARVWGASVVAGGSETVPDVIGLGAIAGRFRKLIPGESRAARGAYGATGGAALEAGQEAFQTATERVGAGQELTSDDAVRDYINSAAMAALPGGVVGVVAGALHRPLSEQQPPAPTPPPAPPAPVLGLPAPVYPMGAQPPFNPDQVRQSMEATANAERIYAARDAEEQRVSEAFDHLNLARSPDEAIDAAMRAAGGPVFESEILDAASLGERTIESLSIGSRREGEFLSATEQLARQKADELEQMVAQKNADAADRATAVSAQPEPKTAMQLAFERATLQRMEALQRLKNAQPEQSATPSDTVSATPSEPVTPASNSQAAAVTALGKPLERLTDAELKLVRNSHRSPAIRRAAGIETERRNTGNTPLSAPSEGSLIAEQSAAIQETGEKPPVYTEKAAITSPVDANQANQPVAIAPPSGAEPTPRSGAVKSLEAGPRFLGKAMSELTVPELQMAVRSGKTPEVREAAAAELKSRADEAVLPIDERDHTVLREMAKSAVWLEKGGQGAGFAGQVTPRGFKTQAEMNEEGAGRTVWAGMPEWARGFGMSKEQWSTAVEKAIAGKPLGARQRDAVKAMLAELREGDRLNAEEEAKAQQIANQAVDATWTDWATMSEDERENHLDALFGADTRPATQGAETRAPAGQAEAQPEIPAQPAAEVNAGSTENADRTVAPTLPRADNLRSGPSGEPASRSTQSNRAGEGSPLDRTAEERPALGLSAQTEQDLKAKEQQAKTGDAEQRAAAVRDRNDAILTPPDGTAPPASATEQKVPTQQEGLFSTAVSALREAADKIEKAASPKEPQKTEKGKLADVGENLWYNRRNFTGKATTWDDVKGLNDALKVKEVQKQKVWPKPDYEQLVAEGLEPFFARMIKHVYDGIATAPAGKTDADLERYITVVGKVREAVFDWAKDNNANREFMDTIAQRAKAMSERRFVVTDMMGGKNIRDVLLDRIWPAAEGASSRGRFSSGSENLDEIRAIGGNRALRALQFTMDDAVDAMNDIEKGWPKSQEAWQRQGYAVVPSSKAVVGEGATYREGKRTELWFVNTKEGWGGQTIGQGHATKEAAEKAKSELKPFMLLNKRGKLESQHDTAEQAQEAARELTKREAKGGDLRGMNVAQAERTGPARRQEGENASPERLMEEFGFRGVNFGREGWINQAERQAYVNHAYDALLDLAELLDVPPKALSLNGMLGIAFGAQGRGGHAAAHFVPGHNEINLTKTMGAGTLAHEWGHALDHYFATQGGLAKSSEPYMSAHADQPSSRANFNERGLKVGTEERFGEELRPEIVAAFKVVVETMEKRPMTPAESQAQEESYKNSAMRSLESWLSHFRKDIERTKTDDQALKLFDEAADRLRKGDTGDGYVKVRGQTLTAVVGAIKMIVRDHTKSSSVDMADNYKGLDANAHSVAFKLAQKDATKEHIPQTTSTTYAGESGAKDREKSGKAYWRTRWEMFARAFETWVASQLEERSRQNTFLSEAHLRAESIDPSTGKHAQPYPRGEDRTRINAAISKLVDAIETKETDKGAAMFSRRSSERRAGLTRTQLSEAVAKAFGEKAAAKLLDTGIVTPIEKQADAPDDVVPLMREGDTVHGFYHPATDRTYVVLENLTEDMVRGLVMHEVGVHYGFERMLGPEKYGQVLRRLEVMRKAGNKAVQDAHAQAELEAARPEDVAEETLAYLVQNHPAMSMVKELIAAIKAFLYREFGILGDQLTEADLVMLARSALLRAGGPERAADLAPAFHRAFHGSPHDFERFSTQKIGAGEGAQVYGWGLYFAGKKEVAEHYRTKLSGGDDYRKIMVNGASENDIYNGAYPLQGQMTQDELKHALSHITYYVRLYKDPQKGLEEARQIAERGDLYPKKSDVHAARKLFESARVTVKDDVRRGKTYEVELAPKEDEYLDWDNRLREQSPKVRAALKRVAVENADEFMRDQLAGNGYGDMLANVLYHAVATALGTRSKPDYEGASKALLAAGIPGIKYLDQMSRPVDAYSGDPAYLAAAKSFKEDGQTRAQALAGMSEAYPTADEGELRDAVNEVYEHGPARTYNYVLFDDSLVKVEAKFSRAGVNEGRRNFLKGAAALAAWAAGGKAFAASDVTSPEFQSLLRNGDLTGALRYIEQNGSTPRMRELAATVRELLPSTISVRTIEIRNGEPYIPAASEAARSARGDFEAFKDMLSGAISLRNAYGVAKINRGKGRLTIYLRDSTKDSGLNEGTLLHEAIHAAILARYDVLNIYAANPGKFGKHAADDAIVQYTKVWREFRDVAKSEVKKGDVPTWLAEPYDNPDEFITYALTSPEFQEWLKAREYEGRTLFERFRDWVQQLLHAFGLGKKVSWLDAALVASGDLLQAAKKDAPDFAVGTELKRRLGDKAEAELGTTLAHSRPAWIEQMPAETQEALRKAGTFHVPPTLKERVAEWKGTWAKRVRQGLLDQFDPIKQYSYTAYMLARMTRGADAALEAVLNYGTIKIDQDGAVDVDYQRGGFLKFMRELKGEHDRFFAWVVGNRAERLLAEGKEHNLTADEIRRLKGLASGQMPDGSPRMQLYMRVKGELDRYNKSILDVAERAGLIDGASRSEWEKDFYVPFYRLMEDRDEQQPIPQMTKGLVNQYAFKTLKGGAQALGDPLENVLKNWAHLIDASLRNQAAKASLEAAARVGAAIEADERSAKEMAKSIGQRRGAVSVLDEGKARWFVIEDPFLLDAMRSIGFMGFSGPAMKALGAFKRWLTAGVTNSPSFRIRNVIRDSIQMIGTNPASYNVLDNLVTGWKSTKEGSPELGQLLAGGGVMRFGTMLEGDRAIHVKRLIDAGVAEETILNTPGKVKAMLQSAWDYWQHIGDRSENLNRAALYKTLRAQGKSHLEASFAARDTMDFSMQGTWAAVRFLVQTVPFMNARLQGLYKLGRGAAEDPRRFGIVIGAAALASLALLLAYKDDPDWKQREEWDRDTFWWFKIGDKAYRIPKPFEIGAIASVAERGLEALITNELTGKQFMERIGSLISQQLSMNPVPQMLKPMIEVYANRNSFTDRPIETSGMERLSKSQRIAPGTSATAQLAGKAGVLSPVQIDHLVRGYFGWLGSHIVSTADLALRPAMNLPGEPAWKIDDVLVAGDFVKDAPAYQSKYLTRLYDQMHDVQQAMADLKNLQQIGATEQAAKMLEEQRDKIKLYRLMNHAEKQLSTINHRIKLVQQRESDPQAKREQLDMLYAARNRVARVTTERAREAASQ